MIAALAARWPTVRASLIALAIAFGLLEGCPLPKPQYVPENVRPALAQVDGIRRWLLQPVAWLGRRFDITQRWALFSGASRSRFRLLVEGKRQDGTWQILFRAGDAEHDAYADVLEYRRVRGMFSPRGQVARGQYPAFAAWITRRVLDEHPDFVEARTRLEHVEIGVGAVKPTGRFAFDYIGRRARP